MTAICTTIPRTHSLPLPPPPAPPQALPRPHVLKLSLLTYLLPAPHIHTPRHRNRQIQTLGPRAIFLPRNDFDLAELLAEPYDGV